MVKKSSCVIAIEVILHVDKRYSLEALLHDNVVKLEMKDEPRSDGAKTTSDAKTTKQHDSGK